MIKPGTIGRLCAFFIALVLSFPGWGAIIFDGGFESGRVLNASSQTAGSAAMALDTFAFNNIKLANCENASVSSSTVDYIGTSGITFVDSPVRSGDHAIAMTLYWPCDYRQGNGGATTGKQKPRAQLKMPSDKDARMRIPENTERWVSMSFYVPEETVADTTSNEEVIFQFYKSQLGNPNGRDSTTSFPSPTVVDGALVGDNFVIGVSDINGVETTPTETVVYDEPIERGAWYDVVIHAKLCRLATAGCGTNGANAFLKIYVSSPTRRAAAAPNDELTPVYSDTGANTRGTLHDFSIDFYKYSWHCKSTSTGAGRNTAISDARGDYPFCISKDDQMGWTPTNQKTPRTIYFDNVFLADDATTSPVDLISVFSGDSVPPVVDQIVSVNGSEAVPANKNPMFFVLDGFGGAGQPMGPTSATITSSATGNTESVLALTAHSDGGRAILSDFSTLGRGAGTFTLYYDNTNLVLDTETTDDRMNTWATNRAFDPIADYATAPTFGYLNGVTVLNDEDFYNSYITSPTFAVTSGQTITVRGAFKPGVGATDRIYIRSVGQSQNNIWDNNFTQDGWALTSSNTGSDWADSNYIDNNGIDHFKLTMTANYTGNYTVRPGISTSTLGHSVHVLGLKVTVGESPVSISKAINIDLPDTQAPVLSECNPSALSVSNISISCTSTEPGTAYVILTPTTTAPSVPQIQAGMDHLGNVPTFNATVNVPENSVYALATGIDPYVDKRCYVQMEDLSGNDSAVVACDEYIPALPLIVKKFVWSNAAGNAISCYNATTNTFTPFTGNMSIKITDGDYFAPSPVVSELAYDSSVAFSNGQSTVGMIEGNLESGSINALSVGDQGYNYWATNGTCRADNAIQLTVE